jgi:hypothetical protein
LNIGNVKQQFSNKFQLLLSFIICRVEYIGENGSWTQFIFNDFVPANRIYSFKIKIIKTKNRQIIIGIIDESKQINQRSSHESKNAICYYGWNGRKYPSELNEGGGFKQG